jgi:hypothetical protein
MRLATSREQLHMRLATSRRQLHMRLATSRRQLRMRLATVHVRSVLVSKNLQICLQYGIKTEMIGTVKDLS